MQHALEDTSGIGERAALGGGEVGQIGLERGGAAPAAGVQQLRSLGCGVQPDDAAVLEIGFAPHEPIALHADDEPGDCRRADLFGLGERPERDRPSAEDEHGERRGAGGGQSHRVVFAPQAPQELDGGGMEPVRDAAIDG